MGPLSDTKWVALDGNDDASDTAESRLHVQQRLVMVMIMCFCGNDGQRNQIVTRKHFVAEVIPRQGCGKGKSEPQEPASYYIFHTLYWIFEHHAHNDVLAKSSRQV